MAVAGRYSDCMNNTATPTPTDMTEKAKQFFALAQELIDFSNPIQRKIISIAIEVMTEDANAKDRDGVQLTFDEYLTAQSAREGW